MANVGAMVSACFTGDVALFGRAIDDRIADPARIPLLPGFIDAKRAALAAGAFGVSISGAGPSAFAVVSDDRIAHAVATAMRDAYSAAGLECATRVTRVDREGARVHDDESSPAGTSSSREKR
jgi:homoserine kinase